MSDSAATLNPGSARPFPAGRIALMLVAVAFPFVVQWGWLDWTTFPVRALFTAVNLALIASVGAAAFNLLVGYAGQLSMAHAAMLMVGTMMAGWASSRWGLPFLLVLPCVGLAGAVVGALVALPALRLKGLYLLLATLAFHYIAGSFYHWFLPTFFGFSGIIFPPPTVGIGSFKVTLLTDMNWYWVLLVFASVSIWIMSLYVRTFEGRALAAIEARDKTAALLGVNVARSKLLAFALSSAFVALAGAVSGYFLGARGEDSFPVSVVLDYAVMIVVGGFSSLIGGVIGAFFFYVTPLAIAWLLITLPGINSIQFLQAHNSEINLGLFGLLIVVILVRSPGGLVSFIKRPVV